MQVCNGSTCRVVLLTIIINLNVAGAFFTGLFFLRDSGHVHSSVGSDDDGLSVSKILIRQFRKHDFLLVLLITLLTQFEGTCLEAALPLLLVQEQVDEERVFFLDEKLF